MWVNEVWGWAVIGCPGASWEVLRRIFCMLGSLSLCPKNKIKQKKILLCKSDNRSVSRAIYIGAGYIRFFCARYFISIFIMEHIRPVLQLGNVIGLCFWQNNIRAYCYLNENMWCTMNLRKKILKLYIFTIIIYLARDIYSSST